MVVFDVVVDGKVVQTIRPLNQRPREMYWFMVDQMQKITAIYGNRASVHRRVVYP